MSCQFCGYELIAQAGRELLEEILEQSDVCSSPAARLLIARPYAREIVEEALRKRVREIEARRVK